VKDDDCLSLFVLSNATLLELQTLLFLFFPKSALLNLRCGLSKDAAYTQMFTVTKNGLVGPKIFWGIGETGPRRPGVGCSKRGEPFPPNQSLYSG